MSLFNRKRWLPPDKVSQAGWYWMRFVPQTMGLMEPILYRFVRVRYRSFKELGGDLMIAEPAQFRTSSSTLKSEMYEGWEFYGPFYPPA